jgi:methyl-accepting chemotaxis protein
LTERFSEKYVKKLFHKRTGIEDVLKSLDRLTEKEAQMAAVQVLKATHAVDDTGRVRGVADIAVSVKNNAAGVGDQVQGIGDQVQSIGDQVQSVGNQIQGIGDQVQSVRDQVQGINNMVTVVMDGA